MVLRSRLAKNWVLENVLVLPAIAICIGLFLIFDRMEPIEYIDREISPNPAVEGQVVTIRRLVDWKRKCDGDVFQEIVKPDGTLAFYDRAYRPLPYHLGQQATESQLQLPVKMLTSDTQVAKAKSRGRILFRACGLTSRIFPIEVVLKEVEFDVVANR